MNKNNNSLECGKSELDIFTLPPTQIVVEEGEFHHVPPYSNYENGTVNFKINGDSLYYLDLSQTEMWTDLKITVNDGDVAEADWKSIFPVNNLLHSIFSQIQVYINSEEVENSNSTYPYRAYLENLLCYGREAKETLLRNELFFKDDAGFFESREETDVESAYTFETNNEQQTVKVTPFQKKMNHGALMRRNEFKNRGNRCQIRGRLHSDIFNINKYLLSNVDIMLTLTRSKQEFCFMSNLDASKRLGIKIIDCFLRIRKVKINPSVMMQHALELEKNTAKYALKQVRVTSHNVPFNASSCRIPNIVQGLLPTRIVVGLVNTVSFDGTLTTNPFNFQNYGITSIKLKRGSNSIPYAEGLRMDFASKNYTQAYNTLFQGINEMPNDISYHEYANGSTLFAFDLTPDMCNMEHFSLYKDGSLDLEFTFDKVPENISVTAIIYCEFDKVLELNKYRKPLIDK
jgi:hypothetical protein